jgi:hypothetical protein
MSHFAFTFLVAAILSGACALTGKFTWEERRLRLAYFLAASVVWIVGLSWVMRLIQGS